MQNRYSIADHGSDDVLDACESPAIGFIPWFPLGAGHVAGATPRGERRRRSVVLRAEDLRAIERTVAGRARAAGG